MNKRWLTILLVLAVFALPQSAGSQTQPPLIFISIPLDDPNPQAFAAFGIEVASVGDVNGDGISDLLIGASTQDVASNANQGQAFVFSGADGALLRTLDNPNPQAGTLFGRAVSGAGDINADGIPDLLVGAPGQDVGSNIDQGQALVVSGADGTFLHTLHNPNPQADAFFGGAVAGPGDVNGDGVPDLLVGALGQDIAGIDDQGQAFVFSGADGILLHILDDPTTQQFGALFGFAVAGPGDVNGDGKADVLVGAPFQNVPNPNFPSSTLFRNGQAFVFSGADGTLLLTLSNPRRFDFFFPGFFFGISVADVGDLDGDGTPDLLIGAPAQGAGSGGTFVGLAHVFSGTDGSLLRTSVLPPQEGPFVDMAVAGAPDLNGDGVPDLLVGDSQQDVDGNANQGQAFVFSGIGPTGEPVPETEPPLLIFDDPIPQEGALFGFRGAVAAPGDVNADGTPDFLVGAHGQDVDGNVDQGQAFLFVSVRIDLAPPGTIDIKPGSDPNAINTESGGLIPVAVLSSETLDAPRIDPLSARFGPGEALAIHGKGHVNKDVNGDGLNDMVLHFKTQETGIIVGDTEACLLWEIDGAFFFGCDAIVTRK